MSYLSGTIVSNASPTTALITAIEGELTAHPAWDYVEEVTEGGFTSRVWKCLGTLNGWGEDFYVALMRTSASSTLTVKAAELWNGTLAVRGLPIVTAGAPEATFKSKYGATGYAWSSGNWNASLIAAVSVTSMAYRIIVTAKGLWVHTYIGTTSSGMYVGLFDIPSPLVPVALEFPLVGAVINDSANVAGSASRRPTASNSANWGFPGLPYDLTTVWGYSMGTIPTGVAQLSGRALGAQVPAYVLNDGAAAATRGVMPDVLVFRSETGIVVGDTITVDSVQYVCLRGTMSNMSLWISTEAD